ncbi:MAG: cbb3-type cytochrome c oxidase subunit I [Deltaproteobacteria bacterium]|nr:cbb3-type cytochrome c oxidase subunit I [Deltaproteobacteria bacterium]
MSAAAAVAAVFRRCPVTGLKIDRHAENLIKVNAVISIVTLLVGVIAAIGLVLTRWQAVHLLPVDWFYRLLTAHGLNMLIFFILYFEMAVLYFAGPVMLGCRVPTPRLAWGSFALMLAGTLIVEVMVFSGKADVLFTSYPPLKADPWYYLGIILFAVGALIVTAIFMATLVVAKREHTYEGSVPLVTFGALTAAIIAIITLLHGAAIYIPALAWSLGIITLDPEVYRLLFWGLGHSSQQINVAAQVSIWYLLGGLTVGAVVVNEKISRTAFVLYVGFISMASAHHLLVDPGMGPAWKVWNTSYAMYLAVLASMVHGFTVPAGIETGLRLRGFVNGTFEWLRKAPWSDPGFAGLMLSLVIFGFIGGITGVTMGTEQINILAHNTLRVPGHFHATVVGGTALSFMAVTYYLIPLIFRKKVALWKLARIQPYLFGIGITIFSISMTFAGIFGVPRRHWDISFAQAPFKYEFPPAVDLMLALTAIGGLMAAAAVLIFIASAVISVFFGESLDLAALTPGMAGVPQGLTKLPPQQYESETVAKVHGAGTPGTVVLVAVFLLVFVMYYYTNWKMLSVVWKIG